MPGIKPSICSLDIDDARMCASPTRREGNPPAWCLARPGRTGAGGEADLASIFILYSCHVPRKFMAVRNLTARLAQAASARDGRARRDRTGTTRVSVTSTHQEGTDP